MRTGTDCGAHSDLALLQTVLVAALDGDFLRRPFGRVLELIPLAEHVTKLTAVCTGCYGAASFTKRTVAATQIQLVGGAETYQPVCRKCFSAGMSSMPEASGVPVGSVADAVGPAAADSPKKGVWGAPGAAGFTPAGGSPGARMDIA